MNNSFFKPLIVNIELTRKCPLNCDFCYKGNKINKDMDFKDFEKYIFELSKLGTKKILLVGGDPLCYSNIVECVKSAKSLEMEVNLSTGGTLLNNNIAYKLKKAKLDGFFVSLNGSTEKINRLSRDGYNDAINAINIAVNNKLNVYINFVVRDDNINDLNNVIKLAKNMGVLSIHLLSNKKDKDGKIHSQISKDNLNILHNIIIENESFLEVENCMYCLGLKDINPIFKGCIAGKVLMVISCDGEFMVCPHTFYKKSYKNIEDFWLKDTYLKNIREFNRVVCSLS